MRFESMSYNLTNAIEFCRGIRTQEAAKFLGISSSTMAKMRQNESGPGFIKFRRTVTYTYPDLIAFRDQHRARSTSEYAFPKKIARAPASGEHSLNTLAKVISPERAARILSFPREG